MAALDRKLAREIAVKAIPKCLFCLRYEQQNPGIGSACGNRQDELVRFILSARTSDERRPSSLIAIGTEPEEPELVDFLPCENCGDRSTNFSPHDRRPLCWECAVLDEYEKACEMRQPEDRRSAVELFDLVERLSGRCWDATAEFGVELRMAALVYRLRCNVTLSPYRIDPYDVLSRMVREEFGED